MCQVFSFIVVWTLKRLKIVKYLSPKAQGNIFRLIVLFSVYADWLIALKVKRATTDCKINPLGTTNVYTKFYGNLASSFCDILLRKCWSHWQQSPVASRAKHKLKFSVHITKRLPSCFSITDWRGTGRTSEGAYWKDQALVGTSGQRN